MTRWIGQRTRAVDWEAKTSGRELYAADVHLPGTLVGRVLRSPHPHARIRRIDTTAAQALPGVHAVVTAADLVPGARYVHSGEPHRDRPPLADGVVRYIGEEVAAVAAESQAAADAALAAIRVRYQRLRAPLTISAALAPGAPVLHQRATGQDNVSVVDDGELGELATARANSVACASGDFWYPRIAHAPLEPNTTLAHWDAADERLHLWTSSQSPAQTAEEIAQLLRIRYDQVQCHDVSAGGGFGSKSHVSEHEVIAALLSMTAGRPVLLAMDRQEEFAATKPRHAFRIRASAHSDPAGRICWLDADLTADNGAYNHYGPSVLRAAARKFGSLYCPDAVTWRARLVDTALPPGGQFRGYGGPQAIFALESVVDDLATQTGHDPLAFRVQNAYQAHHQTLSGLRVGSARMTECLEAAGEAIGWTEKKTRPAPWRGVGVAVAMHGSGAFVFDEANRSDVRLSIGEDGEAEVEFGGADAGTGQRTILAQIVAEELGLDLADVRVVMSVSDVFDLGAWSSRGTHMGGHAARQGASELAARLRVLAAEKLSCDPADVTLADGNAVGADQRIPLGDLVRIAPSAQDGRLVHCSSYVDPRMERPSADNPTANYSASYSFAAHAAEVEVDPATGKVTVLRYVAAHDLGRALNPTMAEGQISGAVVQGLGAALGEELIYEGGRTVNPAFLSYALPRCGDVPRVETILVEGEDEAGPYGAKSIGEIPILPVAPAIANAIKDATGIRFRELPITPDKILAALGERDTRGRRTIVWRRPARWEVEILRRAYPHGVRTLLEWATRFTRPAPGARETRVEHPATIAQLAAGAAQRDAAVLGGGTDLLSLRSQGLSAASRLLSVRDIEALHVHCIDRDGWLEIGAGVRLADLEQAGPLVPALIAEAVRTIASSQTRAAATVGGNLLQAKRCWFYRNGFPCYKRSGWTAPCYAVLGDHRFYHAAMDAHRCQATTPSDLATVLLALDAVAVATGPRGSERIVPVARLYDGPGESVLRPGEVLRSVRLPSAALTRAGAFAKLSRWDGDFAIVSVAVTATVTGGLLLDPRVVVGAVAPTQVRVRKAERALAGTSVCDAPDAAARALGRELERRGHPLPGNAWKLDAACGLVLDAVTRLGRESTR